jgi:hypothetical protein
MKKLKNIIFWFSAMSLLVGFLPAQASFTQWAQTPPMGWNSWDCYGPTVEEHEVKANADYMARHLKQHGWEYVVVDIRWFVENDKAGGYNQTNPRYVTDEYGRYLPATNRFPSATGGKGFKPLADYIHSKGLKFGIHIMRGVPKQAVEKNLPVKGTPYTADQIYSTDWQCEWLRDNYTIADKPGAQEYYNSIMELYASWGVDFIKIDDLSRPYHRREVEMIRQAIDRCGRPIVLSMSPGKTPIGEATHASTHSNMWRMVDDVWDIWKDLTHLMLVAQDWYPYISPTWPDCDMIPLGRISIRGERGKDRMTRLTRDEQYSLMTFFTIFRSPLMFGGDLPSNDDFTLSLLTNDEVLRMHREGTDVRQVFQQDGKIAVTSRNPFTGERYLAIFNSSDRQKSMKIQVNLQDIRVTGACTAKNLWTGELQDCTGETFSVTLSPHACGLYALKPESLYYPVRPALLNDIDSKKSQSFFTLKIRIPSWVQSVPAPERLCHYADKEDGTNQILVNGKPQPQKAGKDGYVEVAEMWKSGDAVELQLPMQVHRVKANANVKNDAGKYVVERVPLIHCIEKSDNQSFISHQTFAFEWRERYPQQKLCTKFHSTHGQIVALEK